MEIGDSVKSLISYPIRDINNNSIVLELKDLVDIIVLGQVSRSLWDLVWIFVRNSLWNSVRVSVNNNYTYGNR